MDNLSNPQREADLEEMKKEMGQLTSRMAQIKAYLMGENAKLETELVDERERNRELERKIAEASNRLATDMDDLSNLPIPPRSLQSISSFSKSPEMLEMTEELPEKSFKCIEEPATSFKKIVSFVLPIFPNSKQINQLIGMDVLAVGLFITIFLLFHQISSSIQQSDQLDQFRQEMKKDKDVEMSQLTEKMVQIEANLMREIAKLEVDLVDGRERIRDLERKVAEMKRKIDDLEAQLRTEVRERRAEIGELEGKINALQSKNSDLETQIQFERENKTAEIMKLQADLNRTMTHLDLLDLEGWSYWAKAASWYKAFDQEMSFDEAEAYCASRKGHLVTIHSQEEHDFVWKLAKTVSSYNWFWIGLKRNPNKGNAFEWTDGSSVDFTNWNEREPDSKTQAALSHTGKWQVILPTYHRYFICKRSSQL